MQIYKNKTQISKPQNIILRHLQGGGNPLIIYNLRKQKKIKKMTLPFSATSFILKYNPLCCYLRLITSLIPRAE